ncbi:MAG: protein kinase family protein, partial [Candidatus Marinimicrobia bacterium]|nr:protein kinase family protein [Candidatus Neomarinimicrobiota bacterium]
KSAIEVALACEDYYNTGAKFLQEDISLEIINKLCEIHTNPKTKQIDFTIWFSQFMWMVKRHGIEIALNALFFLSKISYELLFETSLGDADAGEEMLAVGISNEESLQRMLINNLCYSDIINLGFADDGWHKRPIFHCRNSQWKWEGTTSIVERIERNKVRKTVFDRRSGYEGLLRCKEYEITALKSLNNKHFPKLLEIGDNWFDMEYCGEKLNEQNLPKDWDVQIDEILNELNKANIIHRDIRPHNLMIINSVIKLIDFGWAVSYLHANSDIPKYLGDRWKCPDGFNDKYSIYKSIQSIITNSVIL